MLGTASNPLYLCRCESDWLLFEGGIGPHASLILSQLQQILPDLSSLRHWFITHSHYDHSGAIEQLYPHFPSVKLYASKEAIANFRNQKYAEKIRQINRSISAGGPVAHEPKTGLCLTALPFIQVDELPEIKIAAQAWTVIPTPGHSKCSLSFYNRSKKMLFVSDALGEIITPQRWFPLAFESMKSFVESVELLSRYEVQWVALGHHGVLSAKEATSAAAACLQSCSRFVEAVNRIVRKEGVTSAKSWINQNYQSHNNQFIPASIFDKSIDQLIKIMQTEHYIG